VPTACSTSGGASLPPVAGYMAWYDASQITGQSDNTALASWPDMSSNHNNLSQATPANQPTYYSSTAGKTVNGKPAVWFNGTTSNMVSVANAIPQSVFTVAKVGSLTDGEVIYSGNSNGTLELRIINGIVNLIFAEVGIILTGVTSATLSPFFTGFTFDGTNAYVYINSATSDAYTAATHTINNAAILLGEDPGGSQFLNGPICEMILYPTVLTGPQIASTYTYLKTKWGTP
jgi:Concanavalin A-like lectin/glucanases superfamily